MDSTAFYYLLAAALVGLVFFLFSHEVKAEKKKSGQRSEQAPKPTEEPNVGTASPGEQGSAQKEKEEKHKEITDSIDILKKAFGVPYPFFHFVEDRDDCLYLQIHDALDEADNGEFTQLRNALEKCMHAIFAHVGAAQNTVGLKIEALPVNKIGAVDMGQYAHSGTCYGNILIKYKRAAGADKLISTLAHECMHHHLRTNKVWLEDTARNEILTDVAVVFFGLSSTMAIGYEKKTHVIGEVSNSVLVNESKLGYISTDDAKMALSVCNALRQKWLAQKNKIICEKDKELTRLFVLNRALFQQSLSAGNQVVLQTRDYALLAENASDHAASPAEIEGRPRSMTLSIDGDYRKAYRQIMQFLDRNIKKYEEYNMALNRHMGYL